MNWVLLSLTAPIFWALSNYIDKYSLEKYTKNIADFLFFGTISNWIFFPILILIFGVPLINLYSLIALGTGILLVISYGFYAKALQLCEASYVIIFFQLIPVVTLVLGFLFLNQTITTLQFLALIVVLAGGAIIAIEKPKEHFFFSSGTSWLLGAVFIWSIMFLITDWSISMTSFSDFITFDTLGTALAGPLMFLFPSLRRNILLGFQSDRFKKIGWFTFNNLLDFLGQFTMKKAISLAPSVGLVTIITQVQSFYGIILGLILTILLPNIFTENISKRRLLKKTLGALVMFTGIFIIYLNI